MAPPFAFEPDTLAFLEELRGDNTKEWFDAHLLDGQVYKRVPTGWAAEADGAVARFLRHSALFVHVDEPAALALDAERLLPTLDRHWTALAPLHRWLVTHVQRP